MQKPFIILALPRSRTAWLSHFLSYPPKRCGHDIGADSSSVKDFLIRLSQLDGTVETGAVIGWKLIRRLIPQATIIVIKRPISEIRESLARFGIKPIKGELETRRAMLDECAASPGVTSFDFDELNDPLVCRWIFETCLGFWLEPKWYRKLSHANIQIDVPERIRKLIEGSGRLEAFKAEVAAAMETEERCSV
jgi:hypothetical protein